MDSDLIKKIEEDIQLMHQESSHATPGELDTKWSFLTDTEPKRFINDDLTIDRMALANFRKLHIFISDEPSTDPSLLHLRNWVSGAKRGTRTLLRETFEVVERLGYLDLLEKYPVSRVGNPYVVQYRNYTFTFRWLRHIIFLGRFNDFLRERLGSSFTLLDIGSSYGKFSYLVKKQVPGSRQILLDFPEQLLLARYFLGTAFPQAKIAGYKELARVERISRDFLKTYDFILVPWFMYEKLEPRSVDLVANFASLGEMKREWFDYYLKQEPFLSAPFFFTCNRFQSWPTYDTDLSVLDYPFHDFDTLLFQISPYFSHYYARKRIVFAQKIPFPSQYFEFIGERKTRAGNPEAK